ncbi:MAG TPA: PAS domain-containing protein, partial [Polyangia bacterium]
MSRGLPPAAVPGRPGKVAADPARPAAAAPAGASGPATRSAPVPPLRDCEDPRVGVLLATMPAALLLVDSHHRVVWANPAARSLLRLPVRDTVPLDSCGTVGGLLGALTDALAPTGAAHEWWRRVTVPPSAVLQVVARRVDAGHCVLLVRQEAPSDAAAHEALVQELGLLPAEARLALRIHRGLAVTAIAAAFGVGVGTIRMRLMRLRQRLDVARRHDLFVVIDDVLVCLPLAAAPLAAGDRPPGAANRPRPDAAPAPRGLAPFLQGTSVGLALCT